MIIIKKLIAFALAVLLIFSIAIVAAEEMPTIVTVNE